MTDVPNEPTHNFLNALGDMPSWAAPAASWVGGMVTMVAAAFLKRGESINATIDSRMKMWFDERDRERNYLVARIKALEEQLEEAHEKARQKPE
jgi:hypothetical protein